MSKMYYEKDGNLALLEGKKVAIIGYGSQGHAHALNLHESGVDVTVGLYEGSKSWARAEEAGLKVMTAREAAEACDIIMILVNDEKQAKLYKESIEPGLKPGKYLAFAHGFNIHFGQIVPPADVNVIMIASSPSTRTPPVTASRSPWPMRSASEPEGRASSSRASRRRRRRTSSASRPSCAVASAP